MSKQNNYFFNETIEERATRIRQENAYLNAIDVKLKKIDEVNKRVEKLLKQILQNEFIFIKNEEGHIISIKK